MRGNGNRWTMSLFRLGLGAVLLAPAGSCAGSGAPPGPSPLPTPPADRPLPVSGDYTLTMTVGASCLDQVPEPFHVRRYEVTIVPEGTYSRFHFADPAVFPAPNFACVCGRVSEGKNLLDLTFYEGREAYIVVYQLYGEGLSEDGRIRAALSGRISGAEQGGADFDCTSADHEAELTPR